MLKDLIFSNDELTIQFFADQFYISRTVILKDLEWVSQWLSEFNLQLFKTQHRGIGIIGDEVSRRNAIAGFFDIYKTKEPLLMKDFDSLGEEKYLKLKNIYPKIAEYGSLERDTAEYIATRIETEYNLEFPESERIYICMHLMSYNTFNYVEKGSSNDSLKNIPKKIELLAICLIEYVDARLGTSFVSDKLLFFGIIFHLKNSIQRLENNVRPKAIHPGVLEGISIGRYLSELSQELEIVDVCSSFQLVYKAESEYDFIITTVPLKQEHKPIADLSHVTKNYYGKFLEDYMFSLT